MTQVNMTAIATFQDNLANDGYALVRGLVSAEWCQRLRGEAARFGTNHALSVQVQLVHRSAAIREFVTGGPQLPWVIAALGDNVCFTHQQFVTKHPDPKTRSEVPWHQDNGYGRLEPPDDLTAWMSLDDCDEENGCLWVIPGSHRWGLRQHNPEQGLMAAAVDERGVALPMQAGDMIFFGSLLMHCSLPNRTDQSRIAMYARYCNPAVKMTATDRPVLEDAYSWMVAGEAPW